MFLHVLCRHGRMSQIPPRIHPTNRSGSQLRAFSLYKSVRESFKNLGRMGPRGEKKTVYLHSDFSLTTVLHFVFTCWIVDMYCFLAIGLVSHHMNYDIRYPPMNTFMKRGLHLNGKSHLLKQIKQNTLFYWKCYSRLKLNDILLMSV